MIFMGNATYRPPPSWILFFGHISVASEDICIKFGRSIDIGHVDIGPNSNRGKIQEGSGHHLENT